MAFLYMHYSIVMEHQSRRGETLKMGASLLTSTRRRLGFLKVLLVLRWPLPHSFRAPRSTFIVHSLLASLTTDYKSRLKFTLLLFVGRLKTLFFYPFLMCMNLQWLSVWRIPLLPIVFCWTMDDVMTCLSSLLMKSIVNLMYPGCALFQGQDARFV